MHIPVMLNEVVQALDIKPEGIYIDLTLGRAGHSSEILKKITLGKLIAFDKDIQAIEESKVKLSKINSNFILVHSDFANLKKELQKLKIEKVDGIILDLGISSPQIDNGYRGFSYIKDGFLDMRMDQRQNFSAYDLVNSYTVDQLIEIFKNFADVKPAKQVANGIIKNRPINTTLELVDVIKKSLPYNLQKKKNYAKPVFQAIRIAVNNEIQALELVLSQAMQFLRKNSKLAIISFHSIEDRIVKKFFGSLTKSKLDARIPIMEFKQWSVKTYYPKVQEIAINKRSKSAKLRVLTKLGD